MEMIGEEGILIDILSRLPLESLLRFRSVCKQWLSIISDPNFAKLHLRRSKEQNPSSSGGCRLLWPSIPILSIDCHKLSCSSDRGTAVKYVKRPAAVPADLQTQIVCGSCNGLVCLLNKFTGTFTLWNPTTGAYHELPAPLAPNKSSANFFYGFGYDPAMDDYKLVQGSQPQYNRSKPAHTIIDIFSAKMGYWRRINCGVIAPLTTRAVCLNGSLHWLVESNCAVSHGKIVSLSLEHETIRQLNSPLKLIPKHCEGVTIAEDCLSVYHCALVSTSYMFECWILREYSVESSWTKLRSFVINRRPAFRSLWGLICFEEDGKALFHSSDLERPIVIVDPEKGTRDRVKLTYCSSFNYVSYVESFISPLITPAREKGRAGTVTP